MCAAMVSIHWTVFLFMGLGLGVPWNSGSSQSGDRHLEHLLLEQSSGDFVFSRGSEH